MIEQTIVLFHNSTDGYTCTTLTAQWINDQWQFCNCIVDFKVFHGSTAGTLCGEGLFEIFDQCDFEDNKIVIVITDTTTSMAHITKNNNLSVENIVSSRAPPAAKILSSRPSSQ